MDFEASELFNRFCHISVVHSECMPDELSTGILGNKSYRELHARFGPASDKEILRSMGTMSPRAWYSLARRLMRGESLHDVKRSSSSGPIVSLLDILEKREPDYVGIWATTRPALEEYKRRFEAEWSPISDRVLSRMSSLTKTRLNAENLRVHFVDCLYGGFAWGDSIALNPFPDLDVEKKLLTHELSELMTPSSTVSIALDRENLDSNVTHTVVDLIAFFSVKEFVKNLGRKGMKPNPNYYPMVNVLYPLVERYASCPETDFDEFVESVIPVLKKSRERTQLTASL